MHTSDWVTVAIAIASLLIATWSAWTGNRSRHAAEESVVTGKDAVQAARDSATAGVDAAAAAKESVQVSKVSAQAAQESAQAGIDAAAAAKVSADQAIMATRLQLDERHDALCPDRSTFKVELRPGMTGRTLFGAITLDRDYRVYGEAVTDRNNQRSISRLGLYGLRRAGVHEFAIEGWPDDRSESQVTEIFIKFWPPAAADDPHPWTCRCGRPVEQGNDTAPGHWELRLPVHYDTAVGPGGRGAP